MEAPIPHRDWVNHLTFGFLPPLTRFEHRWQVRKVRVGLFERSEFRHAPSVKPDDAHSIMPLGKAPNEARRAAIIRL